MQWPRGCSYMEDISSWMSFSILRMILAGTPPTMQLFGTSLVTTAPAATITLLPMVAPGRMVQFPPIHTSSPMVTDLAIPRCFRRPAGEMGWFTVVIRVLSDHHIISDMDRGYVQNGHIVVCQKILSHMNITSVIAVKFRQYRRIFLTEPNSSLTADSHRSVCWTGMACSFLACPQRAE